VTERTGVITFKGNPMTLLGDAVEVGQNAPPFALTANDMSTKTLADFSGKTIVLSIVPSVDTPVCDSMTRRFNEEAAKLDDAVVLTVSMDLPMAQKRWCAAAGVDNVILLSDYKDHTFGTDWGVRIKELGLLARAVYIVDKSGTVAYREVVREVTEEPDYAAAIEAAKSSS